MSKQQKLWSINRLSTELQRNQRTIARALTDVPEDGKLAGRPAWFMSSAVAAMRRYEGGSNRFDDRHSVGDDRSEDWRSGDYAPPPYVAAAADRAFAMLDRMHDAATVEERRAIYDPTALDEWQAAFEREYDELGPEFERIFRPTQSRGGDYYRVLVAKLLAGEGGAQ
jgi:hypothetical protein